MVSMATYLWEKGITVYPKPIERGIKLSKVNIIVDFGNGHTKKGKQQFDQNSQIFIDTISQVYKDLYYIYKT